MHSNAPPRFTQAYVYILASSYKRLYTGVTPHLAQRIHQHKNSTNPNSFTSRYKIDKLVYYETFTSIDSAIAREKEIKGWLRIRKIQFIIANNPTWRDLSLDFDKPIEPFNESKLRPPTKF
jgi:putative endonuclease